MRIFVIMSILLTASCSDNPAAYTLFSTSGDGVARRDFVAVFDQSAEPRENHKACIIEKRKIESQGSGSSKYWCEKGHKNG